MPHFIQEQNFFTTCTQLTFFSSHPELFEAFCAFKTTFYKFPEA